MQPTSPRTFAQVARDVAGHHLPDHTLQRALEHLGSRADLLLDSLDAERRIQLVTQFVRGFRDVGVEQAHQIEYELFRALGAAPTAHRAVAIKDAISLVTLRNHVQQLTTAVGMPWSLGMQVQSAVSEIARFLAANGGGKVETEAMRDGTIQIAVTAPRRIGPIEHGAGTPVWLVGAAKLAQGFRTSADADGTHIELRIPMAASMVA